MTSSQPQSSRQRDSGSCTVPVRRLALGKLGSGTDSELVQDAVAFAKAGDPEGLHFLYLRYAADITRYVNSVVHDQHEAEDITHNVFAKLIKTIDRYEQRDVPFTAWILRVARNAALDHVRAKRAIPTEDVRAADNGQGQLGLDRSHALREALETLPEDQREVLVLRHIVGLSPVEIAAALDKTESSVHGLHHRGRRTLKESLTELGAAPVVGAQFA